MQRQLMVLVVFVSLFVAASCTRGASPEQQWPLPDGALVGTSGEDVEATITRLEREWVAAIVKKDSAALDRLLAEDFSGTRPTAHLYSKEMAISDLTRGTYTVESMELDEISVNAYGDTAVAFTSQEETSRYDGKDVSGHYHYTTCGSGKMVAGRPWPLTARATRRRIRGGPAA